MTTNHDIEFLKQQLTPEQLNAVYAILENSAKGPEKLNQEKLAATLGITDRTLRKWKAENPAFNALITKLSTNALRSNIDFVDAKLLEAVGKGHIRAMQLFYQRAGILQQVAATTTEQLVDAPAPISAAELRSRIEALKGKTAAGE